MEASPVTKALRSVLGGLSRPVLGSDAELLERFVAQRDEAAFTALVQRHGPMVLRVCRRMLANPADAEDAFQATFVVLARRAAGIVKRPSLASWLHGVARHTSLHAQRSASQRRTHEQSLDDAVEPCREQPLSAESDLRPILDEELSHLPERYRAPLVLCYLESRSVDEAAAELGVARGTVASRMSRGRDLLRNRLAKRGLALSAAALTAQLESTAGAAIPAAMLGTLIPAGFIAGTGVREGAVVLAKEALQGMFWSKVRWGGALLACLLVFGTASVKWAASSSKTATNASVNAEQGDEFYVRWRFDDGAPTDIRVLDGQWTHRPGKPGLMVIPKVTLLLPTRMPKRPFLVSVMSRGQVQAGVSLTTLTWMRYGRALPQTWWFKGRTTAVSPGDRLNWYLMGRWEVLAISGNPAVSVHDYDRPYPSETIAIHAENQVIEEIELRGLRWQELPAEVRQVEQTIQTMKIGPERLDERGKLWDERGMPMKRRSHFPPPQ